MELTVEHWQDQTWKTTTVAPVKAGEQKFTLSQLVFADGTIVNVSHDLSVEVMKSAPTVKDYAAQDILEKDQVKFRFDLTDEDQSFLFGRIQLVSSDGTGTAAEQAITQTGTQEFTLDVEERREYVFRVLLSWKKTEDGSSQVTDDIVLEKTVYMTQDYGLNLSEIKISAADGTNTVYYELDSTVKISFRAETVTSLAAVQVKMNGRMYDLKPVAQNVYAFMAKTGLQPGVKELTLEKIEMENGKALSVESENSVLLEVLKAVPKVEGFTSEQTTQDQLKVQFVLHDADGALESAQVQIAEEGGNVLLTKAVYAGKMKWWQN